MADVTKRRWHWLGYHSLYAHVVAPVWLRIPEKHRWTIVTWLDKSRDRCWSDLVSDALATPERDACDVSIPTLPPRSAPYCASVCDWFNHAGAHECGCYCGKFRFNAPDGPRDRAKEGV